MRDKRLMNHIARQHQAAKIHREQTPSDLSKRGSISGMLRSYSDTTIDQITLRQQSTLRNKKIKPSMPKMPWD
jgi:hypothetical protein